MQRIVQGALVVLVLPLLACQSAPPRGAFVDVTATPGYDAAAVGTAAYVGLAAAAATPKEALPIVEPRVEQHLRNQQLPFVLLASDEVERRAQSAGGAEQLQTVRNYWRDAKKIDKFAVADLGGAIGADALLVGWIDDWTQVDATQESADASFTRIGARLRLISVDTGATLWEVAATRTSESESIEQDAGAGDEFDTARRRELQRSARVRALSTGVGPPRFEDVADEVAALLAGAVADS